MDNRCKRFLHEPDWTPNNYDIYINPSEIPANIQKIEEINAFIKKVTCSCE